VTTALDPGTTTTPVMTRIDPRLTIAAAWTSLLMVFAYVDIFSLYRDDVRASLEAGELGGFEVGTGFLLLTTAYILPAALMIVVTLLLPSRANRWANVTLAALYTVTIVGAAVGEQAYYLLGSVVEVALLALIARLAWRVR
jgi:hypothetical protein